MIDIFLDNNAFQRFGEAIESNGCGSRLRALQQAKALRVSCSAYNLIEQIKGITKDHWSEARDSITQIDKFNLEVVDAPVRFLLREFYPSYEAKIDRGAPTVANLLWGFTQLSSYSEFVKYYGEVQNLIFRYGAISTPGNLNDEKEVVEWLKSSLNISDCFPFHAYTDMIKAFPSLKYPIMTLLSRRDLYPSWHFLTRDHFDLLQLVYFQFADYFITQEKRLKRSINVVADPDLAGRAISIEEFIAAVKVELSCLDKRALGTAQPLFFQKRG